MREPIDQLLVERQRGRDRSGRLVGIVVSVVGHVCLTLAIALAPALAARQRPPMEFVQVQIVPLQALGVPEPVTPQRQVEREEPKPRPVVPTEEPEPAPVERKAQPSPPVERRPPAQTEPTAGADDAIGAGGPEQRRGSPFGSPLATSPFGTAVAGFDNPDFVYGYYVEQMLAMIGSNWVRPPVDGSVEMTIHFRIQRQGHLTDIEVVQSSGFDSFDLAGLRAVRLASPLPPLPASFPHPTLGVNLIIR